MSLVPSASVPSPQQAGSPTTWRLAHAPKPEVSTARASSKRSVSAIPMASSPTTCSSGTERAGQPRMPGTGTHTNATSAIANLQANGIWTSIYRAQRTCRKSITVQISADVRRNSRLWPPCSIIWRVKAVASSNSTACRRMWAIFCPVPTR